MIAIKPPWGAWANHPLGPWLANPTMAQHRENLLEHAFVAEILQECVLVRQETIEVLRSEVDIAGYDLVLEVGDIVRHVQLKSLYCSAIDNGETVNANLEKHVGGCVVRSVWDIDPLTSRLRLSYMWYGSGPREPTKPLPARPARRKGKVLPNTRKITKGEFGGQLLDTPGLVERLFGSPVNST